MRKIFRFNSELGSLTYRPGFTLAEVLVTLGIIGVVSAMTIPTLMQNHQRKTYVTQLHKVYNEFQQAADCLADSYTNMNGGAVTSYSDTTAPCFVLASGAAICAKYKVSEREVVNDSGVVVGIYIDYIANLMGDLIIDINGKQGPNVVGRDLFIAGIYSDGSVKSALQGPRPIRPGEEIKTNLAKCQSATKIERQGDASYCFNEILSNNWEMDY